MEGLAPGLLLSAVRVGVVCLQNEVAKERDQKHGGMGTSVEMKEHANYF
jgi:hypothetical protein